ncbi:MAG: hypothetical protein IPJ03_16460 [Ignavibacteriales bacterium]|nr:hypothetical protein [Ignavibacteriales bacterium]
MAYADLLLEEGIKAQYLAVLKPARKVISFTLVSGSVYSKSFDYGYVSSVEVDGVALTEGSSTSLSAGYFYWDNDNQILYIRTSDSANPASKYVVAVFEIYVATYDAHWNRVPTDTTTSVVYFEPLIARVPAIKTTVKDLAFGVVPVQSTGINLNNADKILNRFLYDSSFRGREILVYHWLDNLDVDNIKLVMRGRMDSISWSDSTVSIKVFDSFDIFETEFRPPQGEAFYSDSLYPNLDPQFEGKPIRYVYGVVDGFVPVNIDYNSDAPTTGNNRIWAVCSDGLNQYQKTATVPASPSSTTTRTYLDNAQGITVGDTVLINKTTDESRIVTAVNYTGSDYIEHASLSSGAAANGDTVSRATTARVDIFQQGIKYTALYGRDYSETVDANGAVKFTFVSGLETNLSLPSTLSPTDSLVCRVYGKQNNITLGGPAYGSNDSETGNITLLPSILLDILKRFAGVPESEINTSSFTTLSSDSDDRLGFAIPEQSSDKFPKLRSILNDLSQTGLIALYLDDDLKWKATRLKAMGSVSGTIEDDEILDGSINYDFDYSDVYSDVVVKFGREEKAQSTGNSQGYSLERASSQTAKYLHKINRTLEVDSLHYDRTQAARLALRLVDFYGDRQGTIELDCKNRFFGFTVDQIIQISRKSLPGSEWDGETLNNQNANIRQTEKSLRRVKLVMNDLKGVTDNVGDF